MHRLRDFLWQRWRAVVFLCAVLIYGLTLLISPAMRSQAQGVWRSAVAWTGLGGESVDASKVFWCPMHPQIKSHKENYVCPICNMALVELEGGIVDAPQHLTLTAQQVQQAGLVTVPVLRRKLFREIDTTGRIDYDERRYAGISCWITGKSRIEKLHVSFTGEFVKQDSILAELYSPSLITAQQEYLIAKNALTRIQGDGATDSSSDGLSSSDDRLLRSARQKLKYQGLTSAQIDQLQQTGKVLDRIPIFAPIGGTVIERHVQQGQYVAEGEWLFHLADLTHLWLYADIFEDELQLVEVGSGVELSVQAFPGESFAGKVTFIDPKVKPDTRTISVRVDLDNRDAKLMPGMFARARVRHDWPSVLAVPADAVLLSGQRAIVMIKLGEGTFQPREVELGRKWLFASDNGDAKASTLGFGNDRIRYHEVLAGLTAGDAVVTSGTFLLNAESQFQSVLAKMLPPAEQRATLEQVVGEPVAKEIRGVLNAYFKLSQALADDKLDDVPTRLTALSEVTKTLVQSTSKSDATDLKTDTKSFHELVVELSAKPPKDAVDARTRFGRISHELTKLLEDHGGKTLFGKDVFQFECGMAKVGYERWLWWSPEIHNPYMGQRMLSCGKKLDALEP